MRRFLRRYAGCAAAVLLAAAAAGAETYFTEDQVAGLFFPGETLAAADTNLTAVQRADIARASGVRVRESLVRARRASSGGWLLVDRVIGKHEFIDFALALREDGSVKGVEILAYRETYGHQVRDARWLAQFDGATVERPLQLDRDVFNISGATLSSRNVTQGVRRLLHTWRIALKPPS